MRFNLRPHPQSPASSVSSIAAEYAPSGDELLLTYVVTGSDELSVPPPLTAARADNLWQTTCFELFLRPEGEESYVEFNFSPSSRWAAYRFGSHRAGRSDLPVASPPVIRVEGSGTTFAMDVRLALAGLPTGNLRMGLSAIIEEAGGRKSYWALAHPDGEPDFHHEDCFARELAAAERA